MLHIQWLVMRYRDLQDEQNSETSNKNITRSSGHDYTLYNVLHERRVMLLMEMSISDQNLSAHNILEAFLKQPKNT